MEVVWQPVLQYYTKESPLTLCCLWKRITYKSVQPLGCGSEVQCWGLTVLCPSGALEIPLPPPSHREWKESHGWVPPVSSLSLQTFFRWSGLSQHERHNVVNKCLSPSPRLPYWPFCTNDWSRLSLASNFACTFLICSLICAPEERNAEVNISSPFYASQVRNCISMPLHAVPRYHISICVINNTFSSVKKKSLLFFLQRESFINYVWSPNTFFFTNVTNNYTFWNINLSIQIHKD